MQKRVVGLPFHQFPEVGKLIKPDGHNEIYNITYALTIGHEHKVRVTFKNSFVPVLTDGLAASRQVFLNLHRQEQCQSHESDDSYREHRALKP